MTVAVGHQDPAFVHEAFLYRGPDEFLRGALQFIRDGIEAGEPVSVVLAAEKITRLREALGEDADRALFADMAEVGANPARIIAAWHEFVDEHGAGGRAIRGIGEPIWAERSDSELAECHRHEELLNLAFADTSAFWLLCPYDVSALDPSVVEEAERTHPFMSDVESFRESGSTAGSKRSLRPLQIRSKIRLRPRLGSRSTPTRSATSGSSSPKEPRPPDSTARRRTRSSSP